MPAARNPAWAISALSCLCAGSKLKMSSAGRASFSALLKQAEQLQQRAERRRGGEAADLFAQAVVSRQRAPAAIAPLPVLPSCHAFWLARPGRVRRCAFAAASGAPSSTPACPPPPQARYREALALAASGGAAPPADDHAAALFGCAESLQEGAEAVLAACAQLPDDALTPAVVQQADAQVRGCERRLHSVLRAP